MAEIFEKSIKQVEVVVTDASKARAIGNPIRSAILHILSKQEGSIADIDAELEKQGIDIAPTTVRHHLDILKKAGLVELTRLVDSRGGVLKYYASNVRLMEHRAPEDFSERLKDAIKETSEGVLKLAEKLMKNHGSDVRDVARPLKPCPHCSQEHFTEYVILEVINRAIAAASQRKEFKAILRDIE
ncbi:MAG: winged helix-turn-helix domain-containing protein [Candidatus Hydrothermarchaeaceae archaeon]